MSNTLPGSQSKSLVQRLQASESPKPHRPRATWLGALLLVVLFAFLPASPAKAAEYRAFWVDAWGAGLLNQSQVDSLLGVPGTSAGGRIRDVNCNMVIVQVRRRFDVCYPSGVGEPYMSGLSPADFNSLAAMIKAAHDTTGGKKRVEVHCWSVAFKTAKGLVYTQHRDTPTGSLTNFDNYWPTRVGSTTGAENGDGAFDPGHPKCLEYLVNAHMDLVNFQTTAGPGGTDGHIDGIHYDYIRFEANTEGFNPTSVARYNARYGLSGDPSASSEQFKQWRRDQVTAFVRQMYARIQKTKPWVRQSGSFVTWNPSPTTSTRAGFQATRPYYDVYSDWDSWQQEGIIDMAVPMTYYRQHTMPDDYIRWMNFEKDRKFNRHMIVGPGVYMNYLTNAILHLQVTRTASPAGNYADGFCGYSYRSPYMISPDPLTYGTWDNFAPPLLADVTPTWDDIPDMPWKSSPTNGHMMGTVTIAGTGAWADGAAVSLSGPVSRVQTNDGTGFYAFIDLPPGSYTVVASMNGYPSATGTVAVAVGEVTGNMYELNLVLGGSTPPSIITHPQSQTVSQGANATFTVSASGSAPLSYQWRLYATNIPGATASSYTRNNVQPADAGPYSVVVTNAGGSATSSNATLTVETTATPPEITSQPQSQTLIAGQNATFAVTATGSAPLGYQWRFNGTPVAGATDSTYTRSNVQPADAGSYSVVVTNSIGSTNSADAVLTVHFSLTATATAGGTVSKNPDQASYAPDTVVTLTATPSDTNFLFTGWSGDAGGTNNPLDVTMTANKVISASFVSTAIDIILDNTNAAVSFIGTWQTGTMSTDKYGEDYRFASTASGGLSNAIYRPYIYTPGYYDVSVWYPQGANRADNAPFTVVYSGGTTNVPVDQTGNGGGWRLIAASCPFAQGTNGYVSLSNDTGYSGKVVMADAVRFAYVGPVNLAPSISQHPQSQNVNLGDNATFTVTATGTPPPAYQWRRNTTDIPGATDSTYTRNNVQSADAGSYSVVVSNIAGTVTSDDAVLTVTLPPSPQIEDITLTAGGQIRLQVNSAAGHWAVDAATSLVLTDWAELTNFTTTGGTTECFDSDTSQAQRFYRVRLIP